VRVTQAEGSLFIDAGDDTFSTEGVMFTEKAAGLHAKPVPIENGIELVEGEGTRTTRADEEQVAFCKSG
jgi:hypothetical protein